mmetsp:Transcript_11414/g.12551  ORF Transcript_11414/g.12551 Transcript_11414/m.12551 type:complete len:166 (+) Transcript_11414:510-1007(+)
MKKEENIGTKVVHQLFCTLCVDFLDDPVTLNCGHRYCRHCSVALPSECIEDAINVICSVCQVSSNRDVAADSYRQETDQLINLLREYQTSLLKDQRDNRDNLEHNSHEEQLQWTSSLIDFFRQLHPKTQGGLILPKFAMSIPQKIHFKDIIANFLDRLQVFGFGS